MAESALTPEIAVSLWLICVERRLRTCVVRSVSGSSPILYSLLFINTLFALLFCLIVLRTGHNSLYSYRDRQIKKVGLSIGLFVMWSLAAYPFPLPPTQTLIFSWHLRKFCVYKVIDKLISEIYRVPQVILIHKVNDLLLFPFTIITVNQIIFRVF